MIEQILEQKSHVAGNTYYDFLPPGQGVWKATACHGRNGTTVPNDIYFLLYRLSDGLFASIWDDLQSAIDDIVPMNREFIVTSGHALRVSFPNALASDLLHYSVVWERVT